MKIISWNVNGIRAAIKKDFEKEYKRLKADIFCIQETKAQTDQVEEALEGLKGIHKTTSSAEKKGYSGVSILSKVRPKSIAFGIGKEEHDNEGRVVTTEFDDFTMINVYVPNSGAGMKRLDYRATWDAAFASYLTKQKKKKPIIVTGDFNVAHQPIDLARPKPNYNKTSGYTQVEIDGMTALQSVGLIDAYRMLYPEKVQYSFWSIRFGARAKNVGWRIDYFLVDKRLKANIKDCLIHDQIMGSDHCPVELSMEF